MEAKQTKLELALQQELLQAAAKLGVVSTSDPFITLSFVALPVIPDVRLTDMGVFDVTHMRFIDRPAEGRATGGVL